MILIGNGKVFTRNDKNPYIENGAVAIEGNKIKEIGKTEDLKKKYPDYKYIDAKNRLVMPGFINTHMHYYSTFARGMYLEGKPATMFSDILKGLWWRLDKCLTKEDVHFSALAPMIEQIKCGVTTSIDHHASPNFVTGSLFEIAEVAKYVGIRSNLCYEVSDRDGVKIAEAGIKENEDFIKHCNEKNDDMLRGLFGLHASMTVSNETLEKCKKAADKVNAGFHVHTAEGIEDVADSLSKYDMRVVERWYKEGVLSDKSIAVHCIHITEEEKKMLKDSGVSVVHNPESNMGNAVGVSPVLDLINKGVLVGMGTDGYTADMTESLKVTNVLHKLNAGLPSVGWVEPHQMLFNNNRTIANRFMKDKVGTLEEGYLADVIIVDYNGATPVNGSTLDGHMLFGISGRHVDTTIVNGKIRMLDRQLIDIDEERLMARSREVAADLWNRI